VALPLQQSARQARPGVVEASEHLAKHHHEDSDRKQKANNKRKPNKKFHLTENSAGFSQKGHKQIKH
jgi:hypothetical protein